MAWSPFYRLCILLAALITTSLGVQQGTNLVIVEHPVDQYVARNEPATLNCKVEGGEPDDIVITWYRDGKAVTTSASNPSSHRIVLPSGQLFFLRIIHNKNNKPDVGVYYCNATNTRTHETAISRNATLEIAVMRDDFRTTPADTEAAVGTRVVLFCRGPRSLPEPHIRWKKNGVFLRTDHRISLQNDGDLVFENARKEDSGLYSCVAENIAGQRETNPVQLEIRERPTITLAPEDTQVNEGDDVTFRCQASGDPDPIIIWRRHEGQIPKSRSDILDDKSLRLRDVRVADEGTYICRAQNSLESVQAAATLSVHSEPSFTVTPQNKVVGVGRRVIFRCKVTGNPPPAIFWSHEEETMFPSQDMGRFSVSMDGTLEIDPVELQDSGSYRCQSVSVAGRAFTQATLEVREVDPRPPPIIQQGLYNQTLPLTSTAMMACSASGDPMPTIQWSKDHRPLVMTDPRLTVLDSGTLQISDLRFSDTGLYTCTASSETGETNWSASLIVADPQVDGSQEPITFNRTPEPKTFPGPPSGLSVNDITETSMRLFWRSNTNHGASPVFAYTVEYYSHETREGWIVASDHITEESYVVRGLRPGTAYLFLVRAQNSHGISQPSKPTDHYRTRGISPPNQDGLDDLPKIFRNQTLRLRKDKVKGNTITIRWDVLRRDAWDRTEGVHIRYRPNTDRDGTYTTMTVSSTRVYTLTRLRYMTQYDIYVQPYASNIQGAPSNHIFPTTEGGVPSAAPTGLQTAMLDNNTVLISWSPLPPRYHNGRLTGYRVLMTANETHLNREIITNATTTSVIVSRVPLGMWYRIEVQAMNDDGEGSTSDAVYIGQPRKYSRNIVSETWFISTLVAVIGGTLWFALCVFSVWLYRKRRAKKMLHKNGVMNVPVHKSEDASREVTNQTPLLAGVHPAIVQQHTDDNRKPDVTKVGSHDNAEEKEPVYNLPSVNTAPMKTFYNKHAVAAAAQQASQQCGPYATTTIISANNMANSTPQSAPESAFRPIQPSYGIQMGTNEMMHSSESNADNIRVPEMVAYHMYDNGCNPYDPPAPMSEYSLAAAEEEAMRRSLPQGFKQPVLYLPPPPEHPPPSDIGTPPDSPSAQRHYSTAGPLYNNVPSQGSVRSTPAYDVANGNYTLRGVYSDNDQLRNNSHYPYPHHTQPNHYSPQSSADGRIPNQSFPNHTGHSSQSPTNNRSQSPKFRTISPRTQMQQQQLQQQQQQQPQDGRAYSPRAMSEPENRGPTPPIRGYKLVPIRDNELQRHFSDNEGAPAPPIRMMMPHSPPSPAPEDPTMDRGIQSSLPSLASELLGQERNGEHGEEIIEDSCEDEEEVCEEEQDYQGQEEDDTVTGSMLASWASVTDNSDTNCSSVRSSAASSSDGSFFAEADFASAVAKAAEMSGLTVVGSTVIDPANKDGREKVKKSAKHRQRARRPTSPYSTDSNYSCVQVPHKPYPKSERKKQLQEQRNRQRLAQQGPPVRAKPHSVPQHVAELPSYNKPSFPTSSSGRCKNGLPSPPGRTTSQEQGESNIRTNPLAAFDTRDTPIV